MKTAHELSKQSDEFVGKFVNDMEQYQHDVITRALANPSENDLLSRSIKIAYLIPSAPDRSPIVEYTIKDDIAAYIDFRKVPFNDQGLLDNIKQTLVSNGYTVSMCHDDAWKPYMRISW